MTAERRLDLRAVDDRLVPEAARRLRHLLARAEGAAGRAARSAGGGVAALRHRPQVSGPLLALLVAAGAVAVIVGNRDSPAHDQPPAVSPNGGYSYSTLGPTPGQQVGVYVKQARQRLRQVAEGRSDQATLAIVDLSGYRTAQDVIRLLGPLQVTQVHYRVRVPGLDTRPHVAAVSGTDQIPTVIERSGQVEASTAVSLRRYASTLPTGTPSLKQQHDLLVQQAAIAQAESTRLTRTCACIFAVVVQAQAKRLQALASAPGVRVVDPAPLGSAPGSVGFMPLLPEVTKTVPKAGALK